MGDVLDADEYLRPHKRLGNGDTWPCNSDAWPCNAAVPLRVVSVLMIIDYWVLTMIRAVALPPVRFRMVVQFERTASLCVTSLTRHTTPRTETTSADTVHVHQEYSGKQSSVRTPGVNHTAVWRPLQVTE